MTDYSTLAKGNHMKKRMASICVLVAVPLVLALSCNSSPKKTRSPLQPISSDTSQIESRINQLEDRIARLEEVLKKAKPQTTESLEGPTPTTTPSTEQAIMPATYSPQDGLHDDPYFGDKNSNVLVMIFSDLLCKPCRLFHQTTLQFLRENFEHANNVRVVFRDFPLETSGASFDAANLINCAREHGGYWKMFDVLGENVELVDNRDLPAIARLYSSGDSNKLLRCMESHRYEDEILLDREDGLALGAKGAPGTFVGYRKDNSSSYEGVFIRGAQPAALIMQEIQSFLDKAP